ncbi:MAG: DUF3857 domain-containing transglutaminase family protein [Flammeovirgaceae bacterium]
MKKIVFTTLALLCLSIMNGFAGKDKGLKYPVHEIPEELKEGANAVIREDIMEYEVISIGKTRTKFRMAVTILNPKANGYAKVSIPYNEGMETIEGIHAEVYNALGVEIAALKKKDISDISTHDGYSIASSGRIKRFDLRRSGFPYTIYYEYTSIDNNTMFYPTWYGHSGLNTAVMQSSYKVSMPTGMKLHYKEFNLTDKVSKSTIDGRDIYFWEVKNLNALKDEPFGNIYRETAPFVRLRPDQFVVEGYKGSFDTWKNMGIWMNQLNKGKDDLPPETVAKIKELVKDTPTQREQVKKIYEYLQQNTRYVSIQLGIGGWQPFNASYVDKNSYGDCKALSNYMYSALKSIDIPSYYTLVRAGSGKNIDKDFPASQFNHAFLCVPFEDDTVWLECTSQTAPFNYLGSFTSDRDVLLCTPEGGKIVHTTAYGKADNLQMRSAKVSIDEKGNAKANVREIYTAQQQDDLHHIVFESKETQQKYLYEHFDIPSFTIDAYDINWNKSERPSFHITADLTIPNCASKSGKRLFIKPNMLSKWTYIPKSMEERKSSVIQSIAYTDTDTITYEIPANFHVEYLPKPVRISNQFGSYESQMEFKDGQLIYTRKVVIEKGKFPKETYEAFVKFRKKIVKADRAKAVFVDKT